MSSVGLRYSAMHMPVSCTTACVLFLSSLLLSKLNLIVFQSSTLAYHQNMTNVDVVTIQSSSGEQHAHTRPKRERNNERSINLRKQRLNVPTLPLHVLSPSEEDEVKTSIERSTITASRSIRKKPGCSRSMTN